MTDKLTPQQAIQKIYDEGRQVVRWNVIKMLTDSGLVVGARANFCDKCGGKCVPDYDYENGSYECEFCFWQRVAEAKSDQVNTLTAENAVLKAEVERLKADNDRKHNHIADLTTRVDELTQQKRTHEEKLSAVRAVAEKLRSMQQYFSTAYNAGLNDGLTQAATMIEEALGK